MFILMQYDLLARDDSGAIEAHERLDRFYPDQPEIGEPLAPPYQLILSMLSSRTKGEVSASAFVRLMKFNCDLHFLSAADRKLILPLIADVTFPENKADFIPAALRRIKILRGDFDLRFLKNLRPDAAMDWLEGLPGVGPKVAAAVLNFSSLRMRALVVDTHHYRVAKRMGLLPPKTSFQQAARLLEGKLPTAWDFQKLARHHLLMKRHGQEICHAHGTQCRHCPINHLCDAYSARRT